MRIKVNDRAQETDVSKSDKSLIVTCPCCGTVLHLDPATGAILLDQRPRKGPVKSFEEAARESAARQKQAKDQLARAMEEERHKSKIMD